MTSRLHRETQRPAFKPSNIFFAQRRNAQFWIFKTLFAQIADPAKWMAFAAGDAETQLYLPFENFSRNDATSQRCSFKSYKSIFRADRRSRQMTWYLLRETETLLLLLYALCSMLIFPGNSPPSPLSCYSLVCWTQIYQERGVLCFINRIWCTSFLS